MGHSSGHLKASLANGRCGAGPSDPAAVYSGPYLLQPPPLSWPCPHKGLGAGGDSGQEKDAGQS